MVLLGNSSLCSLHDRVVERSKYALLVICKSRNHPSGRLPCGVQSRICTAYISKNPSRHKRGQNATGAQILPQMPLVAIHEIEIELVQCAGDALVIVLHQELL